MLTALKLFFGSSSGWVVLALGVALTIGAYNYGHGHGYESGHTKGYTEGHDSRDKEVDHLKDNVAALTQIINDERKAQAVKIKTVEAVAADNAVATEKRLSQQIRARDLIIAGYKTDVAPQIQQHCSLSIETVHAINALIQSVNEEPNEAPDTLAPPGGGGDADPAGSNDVGRATTTVKDVQ